MNLYLFKNNKTKHILLLVLLITVIGLAGCSSSNDSNSSGEKDGEESVVIKVATAWEKNNIHSAGYPLFEKKIKEKSNGKITIDYVGGPEAIPSDNQGEAIRSGGIDMSFISTAYLTNSFPESNVMAYTELTPDEERESGALDYLNEFAEERMNSIILGHATDMTYSLYLKEPIESIEEIKGLQIRATPVYIPFLEGLGADIVSTPPGEMYTALERGVIDGVAWPEAGITDFGLETELGAKIEPNYNTVDTVVIMNLDKYNELNDDMKEILRETIEEVENEVGEVVADYVENEEQELKDAGVEIISLSDTEYLEIAKKTSWDWLEGNVPDGEKLKEYFTK